MSRPFLTMREMIEQGTDENDLRWKLIEGEIAPAVFVSGDYARVQFRDGVPTLSIGENGSAEKVRGMFFLQRPIQTAPLDAAFSFFTEDEKPTDASRWWQLGEEMCLEHVIREAVVYKSQLPKQSRDEPKALSAKERSSLHRMLVAMAIEGYVFDPKASRSETPGEIAKDVRRLGMDIDADTVRAHLKAAVSGELPSNWHTLRAAADRPSAAGATAAAA